MVLILAVTNPAFGYPKTSLSYKKHYAA